MRLCEILMSEKNEIIEQWFDAIISFYPEETIVFIKKEKDRFLNPIRTIILDGIDSLFDFFVTGENKKLAIEGLESIIKLMALDHKDTNGATLWGGYIKEIIREKAEKFHACKAEMDEISDRIDALMDAALNIYLKCREDIERIRERAIANKKMFCL